LCSKGIFNACYIDPLFFKVGSYLIDNSSVWRMEADVPLIVPEVNMEQVTQAHKLIANPNCSTIQLMLVLHPISLAYGLERVVISTYQSVTGTGADAVKQLKDERSGRVAQRIYPHQIDLNCLPHGGDFLDNGYTTEEMKLVNESRKILNLPELKLTATVVRVPVLGGHSESVNIEVHRDFDLKEIKTLLSQQKGILIQDEPSNNEYPMPLHAEDRDEVFVGRIRRDESRPYALNLWVVSDNLRKGAATNAIQIAEALIERGLVI
jgi:aspartate-semialdehyde dehydrogenase